VGHTIELAHARLDVEERPGYLFVVEQGSLRSVEEVAEYAAALEMFSARTTLRRAMIDGRGNDVVEPAADVSDALWRWLVSGRAFDQVAFVLGTEMQVVRVNMLARSQRAGVCAFGAVHEAHRWLTGRQRALSQSFTSPLSAPRPEGVGNTPVPPRGDSTLPPDPRPPDPRRSSVAPRAPERSPSSSGQLRLPAATPVPPSPAPPRRSAGSTGSFPAVAPGTGSRPRPDGIRRGDVLPTYREESVTLPPRRKPEGS
jgi:hypothetical protein